MDIEEEEGKEESLSLFSEKGGGGNRRATYRFVEVPARRFVTVEPEVGEGEDPTEVVVQAIEKHDVRDAVVRVIYRVKEEQAGTLDLKRVHEALREAFVVAGIVPRTEARERAPRAEISEDLGVVDALNRYVESRPELGEMEEEMKSCARVLEGEWERRRRGGRERREGAL